MKRWQLIAIAIAVYLIFVITTLPAQFGLWLVEIPKGLHVSGVSGSLWSGQAASVSWKGQTIDELSWKTNVTALLTGSLELYLVGGQNVSSDIEVKGTLGRGSSGWYAQELQFSVPATLAASAMSSPMPVELGGWIEGNIKQAQQGSPWCDVLDAQVEWTKASVEGMSLPAPLDLDDTMARLSCNNGSLVADISDKGQVLGLAVQGVLDDKQYHLEGHMAPGSLFPDNFKQALSFFANPVGQGRYQIELSGDL